MTNEYDARPVQARFEYTVADFREYQRHFRRRVLWLTWPLLLAIALLLLLVILLARGAPSPSPGAGPAPPLPPGSLFTVFLPLVPWMIIFGAIIVTLRIIRRRQGPRAMLAQAPAYHGEMVADIDAGGVALQSRLYRAHYHWEAVIRFRETKRLFLLFVNPNTAMVLPKRAFATPEELDAMRAMAQKLAGHPAPGFPVVPASRPPAAEPA